MGRRLFEWLAWRRPPVEKPPRYSAVRARLGKPLPADLAEMETGGAFSTRREEIQRELLAPGRRPSLDQPVFWELLAGKGVVTIPFPDRPGRCLPIFTSPLRANDYAQTALGAQVSAKFLSSTATQLLGMLGDLESSGIDGIAIDRCPRCDTFAIFETRSIRTPEDLVILSSIHKAGELARSELYYRYALDAARAGRLETARDVALETADHVTVDDPHVHLLLGELGVAFDDRVLVQDATSFLAALNLDAWVQKLGADAAAGRPDFSARP